MIAVTIMPEANAVMGRRVKASNAERSESPAKDISARVELRQHLPITVASPGSTHHIDSGHQPPHESLVVRGLDAFLPIIRKSPVSSRRRFEVVSPRPRVRDDGSSTDDRTPPMRAFARGVKRLRAPPCAGEHHVMIDRDGGVRRSGNLEPRASRPPIDVG